MRAVARVEKRLSKGVFGNERIFRYTTIGKNSI